MSIKIEMKDGKWRARIEEEVWEFTNLREMLDEIEELVLKKDKFGRLKNI